MKKDNLQLKMFIMLAVLTLLINSIAPTFFIRRSFLGFVPPLQIAIGFGIVIIYITFFIKKRIKKRNHHAFSLPLGFALTWIPNFTLDFLNGPSKFQYLCTEITFYYYSIPCAIISLIVAIIIFIKLRKRPNN